MALFYIPLAGLIMMAKQRQAIKIERATRRYFEVQVARRRFGRRNWE